MGFDVGRPATLAWPFLGCWRAWGSARLGTCASGARSGAKSSQLGPEPCVSGFWIIEAVDRDAALALAAEGPRVCNRVVELRPFFDA